MKTLFSMMLLASSVVACCPGTAIPPQPPPDEGTAQIGEGLSANRALRDVLEVIEDVNGGGREIRLRRISSRFLVSVGQRPASVLVQLDLDFLAPDSLEATRLHGTLVNALRAREECLDVRSATSRTIGSALGVYSDAFEVEMARCGGRSITEPADEVEALYAIRTAALRPGIEVGSVDVRKRSSSPARGIEWCTYGIQPTSKQDAFRIDAILGLAQALEEETSALVVTGIELRPRDKVLPGAAAVEAWSFEVEATGRSGA